jgi:hypothetical protein
MEEVYISWLSEVSYARIDLKLARRSSLKSFDFVYSLLRSAQFPV